MTKGIYAIASHTVLMELLNSEVKVEGGEALSILMMLNVLTLTLLQEIMNNETTMKVTIDMLKEVCRANGMTGFSKMNKQQLINHVEKRCLENEAKKQALLEIEGDAWAEQKGFEGWITTEEAKAQGIKLNGYYDKFVGVVSVAGYQVEAHGSKYGGSNILEYRNNKGVTFNIENVVIDHRKRSNGTHYESYISVPYVINGELVPCNANNNTDNVSLDARFIQFREIEIKVAKYKKSFNVSTMEDDLIWNCECLTYNMARMMDSTNRPQKHPPLHGRLQLVSCLIRSNYDGKYYETIVLNDRRIN